MFCFIEVLRAIATILVANSHFKGVYPNDIFSFGGGFGLGIFYLISGYLLANIKDSERFGKWYLKRILRIYIPLFIVKTVLAAIGYTKIGGVKEFINCFFIPGSWFGFSMVVFYACFYVFVKCAWSKYRENALLIAFAVCVLGFVGLFITKTSIALFSLENFSIASSFSVETPYLITQFIWFGLMLLGFAMRKYPECWLNRVRILPACGGLVLSTMLFFVIKLVTRDGENINTHALLLPVYIVFPLSMFAITKHFDAVLKCLLDTFPGKCVGIISVCSLEIYYIQFVWIRCFKGIVFPINLIALVFSIVVSAWIVHVLSDFIYSKLKKRLEI